MDEDLWDMNDEDEEDAAKRARIKGQLAMLLR